MGAAPGPAGAGPSAVGLQGGGGEGAGRWGASEAGESPDLDFVSSEAGPWTLDASRNRAALG